MSNTKESKSRKAAASVIVALVVSMSFTSSFVLSQALDETKSTVIYCSQPLKVPLGGSAYDYQYFAYASKTGPSNLIISIDKGAVYSLENLYPGSHAQLSGRQITIDANTSFILHDLGGFELSLAGGSDVQFAPSEKCDELVATMTAMNGYAKQKLVDDEDLISAQMGLVKAMTAAAGTIVINNFIGYNPPVRMPDLPSSPYVYDATATVKYLEDNGYRGQKFLEQFDSFFLNEEKKIPDLKDMNYIEKTETLYYVYDTEWVDKISGQLSVEEKSILERFASTLRNQKYGLFEKDKKSILDILTTKKIYKHSSDPANWLSLAEYLDKSDAALDVEYKIISKPVDAIKYPDFKDYGTSSHLQTFQRSNNKLLNEIPIIMDDSLAAKGAVGMVNGDVNIRYMKVSLTRNADSLQQTVQTLVHESSHETTFALNSIDKLTVASDKDFNNLGSEGLAAYDEFKFAGEQIKSKLPGFKIAMFDSRYHWLRGGISSNVYGDGVAIFEFIRDKFGQDTVDKIKAGTLKLEDVVDIKGLPAIFKTQILLPLLDETNAKTSEFMKLYDKEKEIKYAITSNDIKNPDIAKINVFIDDLSNLHKDIITNPKINYGRLEFIEYVLTLKDSLGAYRDATPEQRVDIFNNLIKFVRLKRQSTVNFITEEIAANVNFYGEINKLNLPQAQFDAVETAANNLLDKVNKIKSLDSAVLNDKSLQSLNSAENSILKNKVPEELTKTAEAAKKSAGGATAIAAGTAMVFALGPKFVEYGQDNNNPYLVATGETIWYSGIILLVASAGATVASAAGAVLPSILSGLALTSAVGFLSGTVIGIFAIMFIDMIWCAFINPFSPSCFAYIQPSLAISGAKGFTGDGINYEIYGFNIKNGIGSQEGVVYTLTYQGGGGANLGSCTVSGDRCRGELSMPQTASSAVELFAHNSDWSYKSGSAKFQKLASQTILSADIATDKNYLCAYSKDWNGETDVTMGCAAV